MSLKTLLFLAVVIIFGATTQVDAQQTNDSHPNGWTAPTSWTLGLQNQSITSGGPLFAPGINAGLSMTVGHGKIFIPLVRFQLHGGKSNKGYYIGMDWTTGIGMVLLDNPKSKQIALQAIIGYQAQSNRGGPQTFFSHYAIHGMVYGFEIAFGQNQGDFEHVFSFKASPLRYRNGNLDGERWTEKSGNLLITVGSTARGIWY